MQITRVTRENVITIMTELGYHMDAILQYLEDAIRSGTAYPIGPVEIIRYQSEQHRYSVRMRAEETES